MRILFLTLACLCVMLISPRAMTDSSNKYSVHGQGTQSCAAYVEARGTRGGFVETAMVAWIGGFITATNYELKDTYDVIGSADLSGALGWLENYCRANPTVSLANGTVAMVEFLLPQRQRTAHAQPLR